MLRGGLWGVGRRRGVRNNESVKRVAKWNCTAFSWLTCIRREFSCYSVECNCLRSTQHSQRLKDSSTWVDAVSPFAA